MWATLKTKRKHADYLHKQHTVQMIHVDKGYTNVSYRQNIIEITVMLCQTALLTNMLIRECVNRLELATGQPSGIDATFNRILLKAVESVLNKL